MKGTFISGILSSSILLFFSCSQKKSKKSENISPAQKTEKKISITSIGEIQFTRSYSEIQSMTDKKQIDRYIEKVDKSNPGYMKYQSDSIFKPPFEKLGIVKGDELLLSRFKFSNNPDTSIKDLSGKDIRFHLERGTIKGQNDKIITSYGTDSSQVRAGFHQSIKYAFLDIIPGGHKELVVLTEDYLMNTEIYTFEVFEIKTKD